MSLETFVEVVNGKKILGLRILKLVQHEEKGSNKL